eukprot:9694511-Alexandrium_andersonii.AAC.1
MLHFGRADCGLRRIALLTGLERIADCRWGTSLREKPRVLKGALSAFAIGLSGLLLQAGRAREPHGGPDTVLPRRCVLVSAQHEVR